MAREKQLMPAWGRQPLTAGGIISTPRYGRRSILCAFLALGLVVAALIFMINVPVDAPEAVETAATFALFGSFALIAPILHFTGLYFGIAGLSRESQSKLACVAGIILNIGLFLLGLSFGWMALGNIGAYT